MKNKALIITGVILSGVGLFGYSIYSFYKKQTDLLKEFQWKVVDFKINKWSNTLIKGLVKFKFTSFSDVEVVIKSFYLDISFNGVNVGYIEDIQEFLIPANGYNDIEFEFSINPQFIIKNATDLLLYVSKQKDATINLKGSVKLKSGFFTTAIPIDCNCSVANLDCSC